MKQLLFLLSIAMTTASFALPSVYVKNTNLKQVKAGSSASTLIADSQDPNRVWVLPPNAGHAELQAIEPTSSASLCRGTKALLEGVSDLDEQRRELMIEKTKSVKEAKELHKIVQKRREELASLESVPEIKEMRKVSMRISKLEREIKALYEELEDAETDEQQEQIEKRIDKHEAELSETKKEQKVLKKEHKESYKKFSRAMRRLKAAEENLADVNGYLNQIIRDIDESTADALGIFKERAVFIGATASVDYDSNWTREVQNLSNNYQSLNFVKIPTYNARVNGSFISLQDKETYYNMLPPIAAYNINGTSGLPYGERKKQDDPERALTAYPEIVAADMSLNLVGACPAIDKNYFENVDFDVKRGSNGVPLYAISTTYEYDAASVFEVKARYNLWSFYEKIVKKSSRGGFFSRKAFVDVVETKFGSDSFSIEVRNDGHVPPEKVEKIKKQVKAELLSRVLNTVARPSLFSRERVPSTDLPAESGAVVMAKGLEKVCGFNVYCQVGGWILRAGDAIFGSTTAQTRFKKYWNHTANEHWKSTVLVPKQGITTYRR